jgi:hypothetical protein
MESVMQAEQSLMAYETACKVDLLPNIERWPFKPQVEPYCGLKEDENIYLAHDIKNDSDECDDHDPVSGPPQNLCTTCVHRVPASGPARDHRNLMDAISPATNWYLNWDLDRGGGGSRSGQITNDLQGLNEVSKGLQVEEMLMAANGGGTMPQPPQYYDYCRKYSSGNKYVLCRMQNFYNRCRGWSGQWSENSFSGTETDLSSSATPSPVVPPSGASTSGGGTNTQSNSGASDFFRTLARRLSQELKKR